MTTKSRFQACLIAGALGDALGYPVEFLSREAILNRYGPQGIQFLQLDYELNLAVISDDTQMTLFTAEGLIRHKEGDATEPSQILKAYYRWYVTQTEAPGFREWVESEDANALVNLQAMHARRAPGNTCLSALASQKTGTMEAPLNHSKGCGGIMRVAPVGLFYYKEPEVAFLKGMEAAAYTHGHPTGYIAAGAFSAMIAGVTQGRSLKAAVEDVFLLSIKYDTNHETEKLLKLAVELAGTDLAPETAIMQLGEGWIAEEALAISVYCALKEPELKKSLCLAVNHDGDSDSTGAICGNLIGAIEGMDSIPDHWRRDLELEERIIQMGVLLYEAATRKEE